MNLQRIHFSKKKTIESVPTLETPARSGRAKLSFAIALLRDGVLVCSSPREQIVITLLSPSHPPVQSMAVLLQAFLISSVLILARHASYTSPPFVSATVEQCKLDCAAENKTREIEQESSWSVWDTQRLVGPTQPETELNATYPYAKAPFPLPSYSFCQLGCSFFFAGSPQNTTCKSRCDDHYARNVSVQINDYAEKVRSTEILCVGIVPGCNAT